MAIHNNVAQDLLLITYNAVRALTKLLREPTGSGMAELNNSDGAGPRNHSPVLIFRPVGGRALVRFAQIAERARARHSNPRSLAESRPSSRLILTSERPMRPCTKSYVTTS
jgi:hypothetical protein